jgi:hypothetical protein
VIVEVAVPSPRIEAAAQGIPVFHVVDFGAGRLARAASGRRTPAPRPSSGHQRADAYHRVAARNRPRAGGGHGAPALTAVPAQPGGYPALSFGLVRAPLPARGACRNQTAPADPRAASSLHITPGTAAMDAPAPASCHLTSASDTSRAPPSTQINPMKAEVAGPLRRHCVFSTFVLRYRSRDAGPLDSPNGPSTNPKIITASCAASAHLRDRWRALLPSGR